ncbi:MAG: HEAT repeat domain-containing protein [Gemmataceae bacterium]
MPALLDALKDETALVRQNAVLSLRRIGVAKDMRRTIVPRVHRLLKDPDTIVRVQAAGTFWKLTGDTKETLPLLIETLKTKDGWTLSFTLGVLGEMKSEAKEALPALRKKLDMMGPKSSLYQYVLEVMKEIDPQTSPAKK